MENVEEDVEEIKRKDSVEIPFWNLVMPEEWYQEDFNYGEIEVDAEIVGEKGDEKIKINRRIKQ